MLFTVVSMNTGKTYTKIMSEAFVLFKDSSGAYVAVSPEGKTLCSTWDRELADSILHYQRAVTDPKREKKILGTWE